MANNSRIFADAANTSVNAFIKHENSSIIGIEAYKDLIDHKNVFANKTTKGHVVPGFTILIKDGVAYSRVSNLAINILAFQGNIRLGSSSSYKAVSGAGNTIHIYAISASGIVDSGSITYRGVKSDGTEVSHTFATPIPIITREDNLSSYIDTDYDLSPSLDKNDAFVSSYLDIRVLDDLGNENTLSIEIDWVANQAPVIQYPKNVLLYNKFKVFATARPITDTSIGKYYIKILDPVNNTELVSLPFNTTNVTGGILADITIPSSYNGEKIKIVASFVPTSGDTLNDISVCYYSKTGLNFIITNNKVGISFSVTGEEAVNPIFNFTKIPTTPVLYDDRDYHRFAVDYDNKNIVYTIVGKSFYKSIDYGQSFTFTENLSTPKIDALTNPLTVGNCYYINGVLIAIITGVSSSNSYRLVQDVLISNDGALTWTNITNTMAPSKTIQSSVYQPIVVDVKFIAGYYYILWGYSYFKGEPDEYRLDELYVARSQSLNPFGSTYDSLVLEGLSSTDLRYFIGSIKISMHMDNSESPSLPLMTVVVTKHASAGYITDSAVVYYSDSGKIPYLTSIYGEGTWNQPGVNDNILIDCYSFLGRAIFLTKVSLSNGNGYIVYGLKSNQDAIYDKLKLTNFSSDSVYNFYFNPDDEKFYLAYIDSTKKVLRLFIYYIDEKTLLFKGNEVDSGITLPDGYSTSLSDFYVYGFNPGKIDLDHKVLNCGVLVVENGTSIYYYNHTAKNTWTKSKKLYELSAS